MLSRSIHCPNEVSVFWTLPRWQILHGLFWYVSVTLKVTLPSFGSHGLRNSGLLSDLFLFNFSCPSSCLFFSFCFSRIVMKAVLYKPISIWLYRLMKNCKPPSCLPFVTTHVPGKGCPCSWGQHTLFWPLLEINGRCILVQDASIYWSIDLSLPMDKWAATH